ncbi:glycosyltransferase family 2 protein [Vibrio sp. vnigr-6D03]|uniref:glycosyltransferase family 2 protein n=1 Tax=Vibrio sp. vnigr-6D03 TaxID=2058088 RepID=UPI000C320E53|nr:glycosyltransferase family 2 protein [Vibrio sp. vnigr-6D03]PKF77762.1 glycosyltransferase family 2 protein [Vibrio sp. vnigr-6D03]
MNLIRYEVIICTYNGAKYIEEQLTSILVQSIKPSRVLISDDGSTDNTIEIVKKVFNLHYYENYEIIFGPQKGISRNFFHAISKSIEEFVFLSDQDDIWLKHKAESYLSFINKKGSSSSKAQLVFSDSTLIDSNGERYENSFFEHERISEKTILDDSILLKNCVQGATVMMNRPLILTLQHSLSLIDERKVLMHDWWLALLAKYTGNIYFLSGKFILYRQHSNNAIGARKHKKNLYRKLHYINKSFKIFFRIMDQAFFLLFFLKKIGYEKQLKNLVLKNCGLSKRVLFILSSRFFYFRLSEKISERT